MTTDEKIVKALEDLQSGQKALKADIGGLKSDVTTIKDVQQKQGTHLEALQADVKSLHGKVDTVELKAEAIHTYQKHAHDEIMDTLFQSNEMTGKAQQALEQRIARIEKHLGLPPLK